MNNLSELRKEIDHSEFELNQFIVKLQAFMSVLNHDVNEKTLKEHPLVKGSYYLPISFMEMKLDEIFFGLWKTSNFDYKVIGNEITASIELSVYHPRIKEWITRTGAAAKKIMVDSFPEPHPGKGASKEEIKEYNIKKNQWSINPDNKKPGALEMGTFGALKADCFKNACISLGKVFGRDVNRDFVDSFNPWVPDRKKQLENLRKELSKMLELCQVTELRESIIDEVNKAQDNGYCDAKFYQEQIERLK